MKINMAKTAEKIIAKKTKLANDSIEKIIKLSNQYIGKLSLLEEVKNKKNEFAKKKNYEKASIERNKELQILFDANKIFKKMKSLRKEINSNSNYNKSTVGAGFLTWKKVKVK
jgi:hypothetical protein